MGNFNKNIKQELTDKFQSKLDLEKATSLYKKYITEYIIESVSDRNALSELIYLEILQGRIQDKIELLSKDNEKAIPTILIDTVHKNQRAILELKSTLGFNKSQNNKGGFDAFLELKKRWKVWRENNQGSRSIKCDHCGKPILLKIRPEKWIASKHPYFKDTLLTNATLIKCYLSGKPLTKDDLAGIIESTPDYVDWLIKRWEETNAKGSN